MAEQVLELKEAEYPLRDPDRLQSPGLLVFRGKVEENIARMREHLSGVAPSSGFRHLRSHAKTCKSSWAIRLQMEAGITRFKATPNELDLLLQCGARDIFLAYPPLPHTADRMARALAEDGGKGGAPLRLLAQVAAPQHAAALGEAALRHGVEIEFLIDLDVGMGRTGIAPGDAPALLEVMRRVPGANHLRFAGLHAYDGHNKGATAAARAAAAAEAMGKVAGCAQAIQRRGIPVRLVVAGGTPAFLPDLAWLLRVGVAEEIEVSPGTWIFWDSSYQRLLPGMFTPAALVFARVMDRPAPDRVTLDLGHKRWAIDSGPLECFSARSLEVLSTSEEHTVLRASGEAAHLGIGDWLLLVPRHVCPTVNLWERFSVVAPDGTIEVADCPVDGRNR